MRHFQDTFETRKQSFIRVFSICVTVLLIPRFGIIKLQNRRMQMASLRVTNAKSFIEILFLSY